VNAVRRRTPPRLALAWSGGKDSALALDALHANGAEVVALLTTVTEEYERVSMHGVRHELVRAQAAALGLPLVEVRIPPSCPNEVYEERMRHALAKPPLDELDTIGFGDLFLADVRAYREQRLAEVGKRAVFPLWGSATAALARSFVAAGFRARVVCLDPRSVSRDAAGADYDSAFLASLPGSVDPCGENGEFHTFVHDGPLFARPVSCRTGEVVERDGFVFCDLVPS
jgi:uncharacterized protein (TIGR00290 family)